MPPKLTRAPAKPNKKASKKASRPPDNGDLRQTDSPQSATEKPASPPPGGGPFANMLNHGTLRGIRTSDSVAAITKALVAFHRDQNPVIAKDAEGYGYDYLSLPGLLEEVRPLLARHKLAILQFPVSDGILVGVCTRLIHDSGEWMESEFVIPPPMLKGTNASQQAGGAIKFARRYAIGGVTGTCGDDEDTDAT